MKDSIEMGRQTGSIEIQLRKDSIGIQKIKIGIVIHMPNRQHSDPSDKNNKPTAVRFLQTRRKPAKKGLLIKQHSDILDKRWHSDYTAKHCYNHCHKPPFTTIGSPCCSRHMYSIVISRIKTARYTDTCHVWQTHTHSIGVQPLTP